MQRKILKYKGNFEIDHIDRNTLNNQKTNLRICENGENQQNIPSKKNTASKYKGVSKIYSDYWEATVHYNKKRVFRKLFPFTPKGEILAAKAYDSAVKKYFGKNSYLNFPD